MRFALIEGLKRRSLSTFPVHRLCRVHGPMASDLVQAGFKLVMHDINPARLNPAGCGRRDL